MAAPATFVADETSDEQPSFSVPSSFVPDDSEALKSQMATLRAKKPATLLNQFIPANFTPTDEQKARAAIEVATHTQEQVGLGDNPFQIAKVEPQDITSLTGIKGRPAKIIAGTQQAVAGAGEAFLSPEGAAMIASPPAAGKIIGSMFMAQMAKAAPEQLSQAAGHYSAGDVESGDAALINGLVTTGMIVVPVAMMKRKPSLDTILGKDKADQVREQVTGASLKMPEGAKPATFIPEKPSSEPAKRLLPLRRLLSLRRLQSKTSATNLASPTMDYLEPRAHRKSMGSLSQIFPRTTRHRERRSICRAMRRQNRFCRRPIKSLPISETSSHSRQFQNRQKVIKSSPFKEPMAQRIRLLLVESFTTFQTEDR